MWNDLTNLRMEMEKLQAKVKNLYERNYNAAEIAQTLGVPERNIRVIIKWRC